MFFSGNLYQNGTVFSGGGGGGESYPVGSYTDPLTTITVTGPILTMGATGSAGPIILQAGLSPNHVLETYTATGPNWAYAQTKTQPGSYTLNTVYGPSGPDFNVNAFTNFPQITFNTSRGYATGPIGLYHTDPIGGIFFNENTISLASIDCSKLGPTGSTDSQLAFFAGEAGLSINSTGPADSPYIGLGAHLYPADDLVYDIGATGYQFRNIYFSGDLYQNGTVFSGGGGGAAGTTGQFTYNNGGAAAGLDKFLYLPNGPTGPQGQATGPIGLPTIQLGAYLVPMTDATYDLGATGIQFKDIHFSGNLYKNDTIFSGGLYTPSNSSDWPSALVPLTLGQGLDIIAKYLYTNQTNSNWDNLI